MKKWIRLAVFLLAFQVEVRVHANDVEVHKESHEESHENKNLFELIESPSDCLELSPDTCLFSLYRSKAGVVDLKSFRLNLSRDTVLKTIGEKTVRLLKSYVVMRGKESSTLEARYANISVPAESIVMVESKRDSVWINCLSGKVEVTLKGSRETVELPEGFEIWVGGVTQQGTPVSGRIRPFELKKMIKMWGAIDGDKESLRRTLLSLSHIWRSIIDISSQRDVASINEMQFELDERRRKEALRRKRVAEDNLRLRQLFMEKVFSE